MKPEVDQILGLSAGQLAGSLAPLLPGTFEMGSASLLGIMMMLSAQEYDRAADIRVAENTDMRTLFKECAPLIDDAVLKTKLQRASQTRDNSLKISMLNSENVELRRVLIALQAHCEDKGLRDVEKQIWVVLKASAERRLLKLA
jgi:hypothetical protein